jgi:Zn-dependent membrane protease YugP
LQLLWPVLLLLHLPLLLNTLAVAIFRRISHTHDWELADDLPQTAGDWLRERAAVRNLRVIVTDLDGESDAFHPDRRVIHLTSQTHFKSDAVFWAIAAHELGHARFHSEHPLLGTFSLVALWLKRLMLWLGSGLAVGNVLYARPRAFELAFALIAGSLVLRFIELLEEMYASWLAYGELQQSAHLSSIHLRVVRRTLLGALGTYVSVLAAGVVLLSQWSIVEKITGGGWLGEVRELTTLGWVAVITLSVLGLVHALMHVRLVQTRPLLRKLDSGGAAEKGFHLIWRLLLVLLLLLVWDLRADAMWAWCVMLAIVGVHHLALGLLMLPAAIPVTLLVRAIRTLSGPGHHASDEYAASRDAGRPLIHDGKLALVDIRETRVRNPTLATCLYDLMQLLYLPLIIAIGGGLIT